MEFGRVYCISKIVACAVCDESDESETVSFGVSEKAVNGLDHHLDEVDVLPFVEASDVVGLCGTTLVEDEIDGAGVVLYI